VDNLKIGSEESDTILKSIVSLDALEKRFLKSIPFSVDKNPIRTKSRKREYVDLRCVFYYLACKHIGFPLIAAGRFSDRDHTSILHMNKRAEALIETDDKFRSLYSTIYNNITEKYAEDFAGYSQQSES
jgi:chromosomal replication initiation ATPase DnaA